MAKLSSAPDSQTATFGSLLKRWSLAGMLCTHANHYPWVCAIWLPGLCRVLLARLNCRRQRIVKLPITAVRIEESAFRGCHWLNSTAAPGCTDFGHKAFADCCSLQYVHANGGVNTFNGVTKLGPHLFDACINLAATKMLQAALEP